MIVDKTEFRTSQHHDMHGIERVHFRAFGRSTEGKLANDSLNDDNVQTLDLVAQLEGMIIGHAMISEVEKGPVGTLVLGPLAVDPDWRDFQIGTELVWRVLADARIGGWKSIFVLGEPDYYRRFGFKRSLAKNVS